MSINIYLKKNQCMRPLVQFPSQKDKTETDRQTIILSQREMFHTKRTIAQFAVYTGLQ